MNTRSKIAICLSSGRWGGAGINVLDSIYAIDDSLQVSVFIGSDGAIYEELLRKGIAVRIVPGIANTASIFGKFRALIYLIYAFRSLNPDIVHCHSFNAGAVGRLAVLFCRGRAVFTIHGWLGADSNYSGFKGRLAVMTERLLKRITALQVFVCNHDLEIAARHSCLAKNHRVIHNSTNISAQIDSKQHKSESTKEKSSVNCLMVARFRKPKNQQDLIKVLNVCNFTSSITMKFIGDGEYLEECVALSQLKRSSHLNYQFMGNLAREKVLAEYELCDIVVLISDYEGFPISLMESMMLGKPIIASHVGGISEAVVDGDNGYLIPTGDTTLLKQKIENLCQDSNLRAHYGANAKRRFDNQFDFQSYSQSIRQTYDLLLKT